MLDFEQSHARIQEEMGNLRDQWRADLAYAIRQSEAKTSRDRQQVLEAFAQPLLKRLVHLERVEQRFEARLKVLEDKMASVSKTTFTSVARLGELKTACDLRKDATDYDSENLSSRLAKLEKDYEDLTVTRAMHASLMTACDEAPRVDSATSMLPGTSAAAGRLPEKILEEEFVNKTQVVTQTVPTQTAVLHPPRQYTATGELIADMQRVNTPRVPSVTIPILPAGHMPYPGLGGDDDGSSGRVPGGGHPGGNPHGGPGDVPSDWGGDDDDTRSSTTESTVHSRAHERRWRPTIKVDSPADYNGKDGPSTIPWLVAVERWLTLSQVPPPLWYQYTATKMKGGALIWINAQLADAQAANRQPWTSWDAFKSDVCKMFDPRNQEELARSSLRSLTQTGTVRNYVYRFNQLLAQTKTVNTSEAFSLFVRGLQPDLKREIGLWVKPDDLKEAIELALRAEVYATSSSKG